MKLGQEQQEAVTNIIDFIENSTERAFLLQGPGGTGKTTVSKTICNYLRDHNISYVLTAPTHKAKLVLSRASDEPAVTIHKLFALRPEIRIWNFDVRNLKFISTNLEEIPEKGLIICDEGSMINDDMYDFLIKACFKCDCKILFMADKAQLSPVQKSKSYSKIFSVKLQYTLTKIYRQEEDNALAPILSKLRNEPLDLLFDKEGKTGSICCISDMTTFLIKAVSLFKQAFKSQDILFTKITAYTNERVSAYNNVMRKAMFKDKEEYHIGEFLTAYDNIKVKDTEIWNSMDYIIKEIMETNVVIPYFGPLPAWKLGIFDSAVCKKYYVKILRKDIDKGIFTSLANAIDTKRKEALSVASFGNKRRAGMLWRQYYAMQESFTTPVDLVTSEGNYIRKKTFDYGYACTTHRLQGSTLNTILVDLRNINLASDQETRRQLQYVALSRTKSDAFILQ